MTGIRRGQRPDLAEVEAIQNASPEGARWNIDEYFQYDFRVAIRESRIAGFVVARTVAPDEREILNIAVAPEFRRQGIARSLLDNLLQDVRGSVFLEVRESNLAGKNLYNSMGFQVVGLRRNYYENPVEAAIVMKFHSC